MIVKRKRKGLPPTLSSSMKMQPRVRDLNSFIKLGPFSFLMNLYRYSSQNLLLFTHMDTKRFIKFISFFLSFCFFLFFHILFVCGDTWDIVDLTFFSPIFLLFYHFAKTANETLGFFRNFPIFMLSLTDLIFSFTLFT